MERIRLSYDTSQGKKVELPFRILILGDFGGDKNRSPLLTRSPRSITQSNFNAVMASLKACFINVSNPSDLPMQVTCVSDLSFENLLKYQPDCRYINILKQKIQNKKERKQDLKAEDLSEYDNTLLKRAGLDQEDIPKDYLDTAIALLNQYRYILVGNLMDTRQFRVLESAWFGLKFLVKGLNHEVIIDILDVKKNELYEDFDQWKDPYNSFFYQKVYAEEFGQYGGRPYGCILCDFFVGPSKKDIRLINDMARVASISHTPILAGTKSKFFSLDDFDKIGTKINLLDSIKTDPALKNWRDFQKKPAARYVGLLLPEFAAGTRTQKIGTHRKHKTIWCNPIFAYGKRLATTFEKTGWCVAITGESHGRVPGLKSIQHGALGKKANPCPLRIRIPDQTQGELESAGFIPLCWDSYHDAVLLYSSRSAYTPEENETEMYLSSFLPYTFMISRIAHYLKMIQRENIGIPKTALQLSQELNSWLIQYVSDMENPVESVKIRKPLRKIKIIITPLGKGSGLFYMDLKVVPHLKYMGAHFSLKLRGQLEL